MAALRARGGRRQGAAAKAMSVHIVEPPQRSRRPPAAATRRAHGSCGRSRRCSSSTIHTGIAIVVAPCARLTIPMRATVCTFTTGCLPLSLLDSNDRLLLQWPRYHFEAFAGTDREDVGYVPIRRDSEPRAHARAARCVRGCVSVYLYAH